MSSMAKNKKKGLQWIKYVSARRSGSPSYGTNMEDGEAFLSLYILVSSFFSSLSL